MSGLHPRQPHLHILSSRCTATSHWRPKNISIVPFFNSFTNQDARRAAELLRAFAATALAISSTITVTPSRTKYLGTLSDFGHFLSFRHIMPSICSNLYDTSLSWFLSRTCTFFIIWVILLCKAVLNYCLIYALKRSYGLLSKTYRSPKFSYILQHVIK